MHPQKPIVIEGVMTFLWVEGRDKVYERNL